MRKKLGFLALAFRHFDVDKSNTIHREELRRALSCNFEVLSADEVDNCFQVFKRIFVLML